ARRDGQPNGVIRLPSRSFQALSAGQCPVADRARYECGRYDRGDGKGTRAEETTPVPSSPSLQKPKTTPDPATAPQKPRLTPRQPLKTTPDPATAPRDPATAPIIIHRTCDFLTHKYHLRSLGSSHPKLNNTRARGDL